MAMCVEMLNVIFSSSLLYLLVAKNLDIKIHKIILLVILCVCETWSFMLSEEHVEGVSEQRSDNNN